MAKKGRPSKFTKVLANDICLRLSKGETLRAICRDENMPVLSTVLLWNVEDREGFSEQYAKARLSQAANMFDELVDIADDGQNDYMMKQNSDGSEYEVVNSEHIQRSRLRVDTRKWYLSKVLPKVYGDKLDVTTDGQKITGIGTILDRIEKE